MKVIIKQLIPHIYFSFFCMLISTAAYAGFFDDLKSKIEKSVSDTTDDVIRDVTGDSKKKEKEKRQAEQQKKRAEAAEASERARQQHEDEHQRHFIIKVQKGLAQLGYGVGNQTGDYDDSTRQAVEKYQKDKQLKVDGKATDFLFQHIQCSLGKQSGCRNVQAAQRPIELKKLRAELAERQKQQAEQQKEQEQREEERLSQGLEYPWEMITIKTWPGTAEKIIIEAGLKKRKGGVMSGASCSESKRRKTLCYGGKWKGKWESKIVMRVVKAEITYLRFETLYPNTAKKQIESRLLKLIPGGRQGCGIWEGGKVYIHYKVRYKGEKIPVDDGAYQCSVKDPTPSVARLTILIASYDKIKTLRVIHSTKSKKR